MNWASACSYFRGKCSYSRFYSTCILCFFGGNNRSGWDTKWHPCYFIKLVHLYRRGASWALSITLNLGVNFLYSKANGMKKVVYRPPPASFYGAAWKSHYLIFCQKLSLFFSFSFFSFIFYLESPLLRDPINTFSPQPLICPLNNLLHRSYKIENKYSQSQYLNKSLNWIT